MLVRDLRHALRQFLRMPGFTLTAVLTLALGIGANAAIFSVVNAVLRHPAGVDHPERIVIQNTRYRSLGMDFPGVSVPDYADAASLHTLVEAAAVEQEAGFNIEHDGKVEHIDAAQVSSQWFQVLGARPVLGRTFTAQEDQPNAGPVAVLSYGLWQRAFGGGHDVLGQSLLLDQKPYRIVGVMPSDFDWPRGEQLWVPVALGPQAFNLDNRFNESYFAVLRLRPEVSLARFNAGLDDKSRAEIRREGTDAFGQRSQWSMHASQMVEFAAGPLRKPLYVLFAVVIFVLLIASANVAGLFLARASSRSREFAIRTALGASAAAIVRQTFAETMLLAGVATALGVAAGPIFGKLLLWLIPHSLAEGYAVHLEAAVLAFTAAAGLLTVIVAGIGPSLRLVHQRDIRRLHDGGRSRTASAEKQRLRRAFVIGEVALAFVLLTGTGLFLASLRQLQRVDPGFNASGVLAGEVFYSGKDFKENQQRQNTFVDSVLHDLASQPGVSAAAAVTPLPFSPAAGGSCSFGIIGRPLGPHDPGPHSQLSFATADYLKVMQIPLVAGRWFAPTDRAGSELVAVIDTRLASKYWPNQNAIGQRISFGCSDRPSVIIGIVPTVRVNSLEEDTSDGMRYYPLAEITTQAADFVIRTPVDPAILAPAIERAVSAADGTQTVFGVRSLQEMVSGSLAGRRLIVDMLAAFAVLALILALVGIYGLISYLATQRTNEVGIRMAVGAQRGDVIRLVMADALTWVVVGLGIGAVLSLVAGRILRQIFADFGGGIVSSLVLAVLALLAAGMIASLVPAARAAAIEPVQALRSE
jgi:predicted permease